MKIHEAIFKKKDGNRRLMSFVRATDLPQTFVEKVTKSGVVSPPTLPAGMEIVWDLDNSAFRVFNWNTVVGDVKEKVGDPSVLDAS